MPSKHAHDSKPHYSFDVYTDGCDEALDIYRTGRKKPLARLRYWTAAGLTEPLAKLFAKHPDLLADAKLLLADMEADLASEDARIRYRIEREANLMVGLWAAIALAKRAAA